MKSENYIKTKDQHARAWAEYLSRYEWDYFGTFTFAKSYSAHWARRAFERFIRHPHMPPVGACFFGIERGERYGRIHLHCLFQFTPEHRPPAKLIWRIWKVEKKLGGARVEPPESQLHVACYAAKYTSKDMLDYDLIGKPFRLYDGR